MSKVLTRNLTTLDLIKAVAVVFMLVDHIGMYFVHDLWLRVAGRYFGATWFFLMGYARSRDLPWQLWAGGFLLLASNVAIGASVFPINSLFIIILIRLTIDRLARFAFARGENLFLVVLAMTVIYLPLGFIIENSTTCFMAALLGWAARNRGEQTGLFKDPRFIWKLCAILIPIGVGLQWLSFGFSFVQGIIMSAGLGGMVLMMVMVPMTEYPKLTASLSTPIVRAIQFLGRRTLEIYVGHLILFKILIMVLGLGAIHHVWFDWSWFGTRHHS